MSKRYSNSEAARHLNVFESQLSELKERQLLPKSATSFTIEQLTVCQDKMKNPAKYGMKKFKLKEPGPMDQLSMEEAVQVSGLSRAELIEAGSSGKLHYINAGNWRFTRGGIDLFKAKLATAGLA